MRTSLRWAQAVVLLLTAACGGRPEGASGSPIVHDSAGVRIVQNTGQRWGSGEAWKLSDRPTLEIGVVEGEPALMLSQARAATRLADGSIAFIDGATREIRLFDASGRHLRSIGRGGEGPGEFQLPAYLMITPGDSLLVWDLLSRRATVFSIDGVLGRTFSLEEDPSEFRSPDIFRRFADGSLLAVASPTPEKDRANQTGPRWAQGILVRYTADGTVERVLGEVDRLPCDPKKDGECSFIAYGPRGHYGVRNDRVYTSRADRNELRVFDRDGRLVSRIVGATALRPVTEAMKTEFANAVVAREPGREAELRDYVSRASFSEVVPAFTLFIVSRDGYVWTREYRPEDSVFGYAPLYPPRTDPLRWTVFDPEGVELGQVEIPVTLNVLEIGEDYVLGIDRDELDVERVHLYSLLRP